MAGDPVGVFRLLRSRAARPASLYSDEDNMVACSRAKGWDGQQETLTAHLPGEAHPAGQMPTLSKAEEAAPGTSSDAGTPGQSSLHASRRCWAVNEGMWAAACRSYCPHPTQPEHLRGLRPSDQQASPQHMPTAGAPCMDAWCTFQ